VKLGTGLNIVWRSGGGVGFNPRSSKSKAIMYRNGGMSVYACERINYTQSKRFRFPAGAGMFSLYHRVQNGSGAHPASYPMGTRGSFPGLKWPGREADHLPLSSAEVKNG
jgi:hypothetical protein